MTLETLLSKLCKVRRDGVGWKALCPAHADKNPSLSVRKADGKTLIHCHAGCPTGVVLAALGIEARDLFEDENGGRRILAEYDYCDEKGALLFQVVRFDPKDFRQRRPDGNGGWTWRLNNTRRVLYRLPDLISASSVLLCEGEKDCETARGLGLVATCNPHGAGKWRPEYSESLRGKRVCIIADADQPGRKHAQEVAASLHDKAQSLKVIEAPDAKDLNEWVANGGTRDSLLELIRNASEWKSMAPVANGFTLLPLSDLLARPDVPIEYVVENLLVAGTVSCVVAKPKVGKSTFARNLCLRVSRGEEFLGLKTSQGECIYLALEEREEDIKNDFRAMGANGSEPILVHAAAAPAEGIAKLCDLVRERRPVLVVIDPLFRMARIRDEKAYAEVYTALGPLIDVAREASTHVMLTHHAGKAAKADAIDAPLGSTAIGGAVCTLVHLKRTDSIRSIQTVQRIAQDLPETVLEFESETHTLALGVAKIEAVVQTVATEIEEYLKVADGAKIEPEIVDAVEGKTGIKRKALRQLVEIGRVLREGSGRRGDPFKYRFSFSCSLDIPGTREQEMENWPDTRINTGDILVPDIVAEPQGGDDSGEQAFWEGKL
jgi:putative DNA primase/helicase